MAATKKKSSVPPAKRVADAHAGSVQISITNQLGACSRYRAHAVTLSMNNGVMQLVENDGRCFLWFDHCNVEVRDDSGTSLVRLKAGAASNLPGTELVILAELSAPAAVENVRRKTLPSAPRAKRPEPKPRGGISPLLRLKPKTRKS